VHPPEIELDDGGHARESPPAASPTSRIPHPASRIPRFISSDFGLGHNNRILFWAMFFNEASIGFYQTLLPIYIASLGASPGVVGLVIGIQGLARLLFLAPAGWVADRVPLRRLIVTGRSLTVLGLLLFGLAQEWWQLLPVILVMSAGNIVFPAISKVIADSTDDRTRTRAFTLIYTVAPSTALLLSPILGGLLADTVSLRSIFFAAALAQGIAVLFFTRLRPVETHGDGQASVGYRAVLAFRPVIVVCGLFFALLLVLTTGFTLIPNYLEEEHGVGIGTIGRFGSLFALGSVLLGIIIARVKRLSPPLNALLLTTALCPVAFLLFLGGQSTWIFALGFICRGGYLVSWGVIYAILGEVTPQRLRSRTFALSEVLGGAGFAIAPFIAGALYEVDPALPIWAALAGAAPLLLAILAVRRYVHGLAATRA
jgi:MFS family permease